MTNKGEVTGVTPEGENEYLALVRDARRYRELGAEFGRLVGKLGWVGQEMRYGRMSTDVACQHMTYEVTKASMSPAFFMSQDREAAK